MSEALAPSIRLDLLPKSNIDVYISVLENDGTASCLAAAITCASVAVADAGIEMLDLVAACSAVILMFVSSRKLTIKLKKLILYNSYHSLMSMEMFTWIVIL